MKRQEAKKVVIDTNVPIVANGRSEQASALCELECVEFLQKVASGTRKFLVVLDTNGLIIEEYNGYLTRAGQPGVGDVFFKFLHDHMFSEISVIRVDIDPIDDDQRGFAQLPINRMDRSDRKFLACAVKAGAKVVNAVDSDWHEQSELIDSLGVEVLELCHRP